MVVVLAVALLAVICSGGSSGAPASAPSGWRTYFSAQHDFSLRLPSGWQRASSRLVPKLLDPREILSVGTFPMRVGGGGNCGREPAVAIAQMEPGDALISIQEWEMTGSRRWPARSNPRASFPLRRQHLDLPPLQASPWAANAGPEPAPGRTTFHTTLAFGDRGRDFEALIYTKGRPSRALRAEIESIIDRLHFGRVDR